MPAYPVHNSNQHKRYHLCGSSLEEVIARLKKPKSPKFIIIDSFQVAGWDYPQAVELFLRSSHPRFCG